MLDETNLNALRRSQFAMVARCMAMTKGHPSNAHAIARKLNAPFPVVDVCKGLIAGHGLTDPNSASLAEYTDMAEGFIAGLADVGVFDRLLADMQPGLLHSQFAVVSAHVPGTDHMEGTAKPVGRGLIAGKSLQALTAVALTVLSQELLRFGRSTDLVERSLKTSVAVATDVMFLDAMLAVATQVTSLGPDAVRDDIKRAMLALPIGMDSRLHLIVGRDTAKRVATMETTTGAPRFPEMTAMGGSLAGLTTTVTDQLDETALLIDAAAIVGVSEDIDLRVSTQGTLDMTDIPTISAVPGSSPNEGNLMSLFQTDSAAILAERRFGFEPLRQCCVEIEDVQWGMSGSPLA